jgi:hypothetical protein
MRLSVTPTNLTNTPGEDCCLARSPDGTRIVFSPIAIGPLPGGDVKYKCGVLAMRIVVCFDPSLKQFSFLQDDYGR